MINKELECDSKKLLSEDWKQSINKRQSSLVERLMPTFMNPLKLLKKFIFVFLICILFVEETTGGDQQEPSKQFLSDIHYKTIEKSFGIYQIAWNPIQFKKEIENTLSILASPPAVIMFFRDISHNRGFPISYLNIIDSVGAIPMISWEWWIWGKDQKTDYLQAIVENKFDPYFDEWCRNCKKWGKPLFIRPGFEMNGNWFPWCGIPH